MTTLGGSLPQGSPTSTIVSALVLVPFAGRLERLAQLHGAEYSQYVDDVTFSGPSHVASLVRLLERIAVQEGFTLNPEKTRAQPTSSEQIVTGVAVNTQLELPESKRQEIADLLVQCEGFRTRGQGIPKRLVQAIRGKISYARQLSPALADSFSAALVQSTASRTG